MSELVAPHLLDLVCLAIAMGLFSAYHLYVRQKLKKNPTYSLYGATTLARTAWVVSVMEEKKDILAVQTLRNSTMAATFMASTSILLAVGLLTLSGQGDQLGQIWHAMNLFGSKMESTITLKLLVILGNLFIAFFNFSFSIRLFNHSGFLINTPPEEGSYGASMTFVAMQLNKAGGYFHMGMRAYYFLVPLVFWLFSPVFMVLAAITVVILISRIEKTPRLDCKYLDSMFENSCPYPE
ncbi:DUF599 family protein [Pseudodesulfovibrio cashew]|uniref:DUF599 family protein n=1 Tax=Pseudodesulfovibrio cashew TaxID=2678688 RepID=A0A6I6JNL6_9BACT|nr:DUF599 domain-containing protein [Pseudodesulfovibrio cashew]QGY41832.1 DUF599 family protein [Pseudodesulfovibrio cashew]